MPVSSRAKSSSSRAACSTFSICWPAAPSDAWRSLRSASCLRSEEHTSELQSPCNLVCRLLLAKKILDGINRKSAITIAEDLGFEVDVRDVARAELALSDEVFLTGTAAELVPVREIDDIEICPS